MKYRFVFLLSTLFLTIFAITSYAGVEPSPFMPEINKLGAITNNLNSIHDRVIKVLACPPDDSLLCPDVNGAVGRLSAMENQLVRIDALTISVVEEVLATPPDDNRGDIVPALREVKNSSLAILETIIVGSRPDDMQPPEEFIRALSNVRDKAQDLAVGAQEFIANIEANGEPTPVCYVNSDCQDRTECIFGSCSPEDFPPPIPGSCNIDSDCPEGAYCLFSVCVPDNAPIPNLCSYDSDCPPDLNCHFGICLPF